MAFNKISFAARKLVFAALLLGLLQGCETTPLETADNRAEAASLQKQFIPAGSFLLTTYSRITDTNLPVNVYIEGDVRGWKPSADPGIDDTPDDHVGLRLAMLDPSPNVVFIAHPCQFGIADPVCFSRTWAEGRVAQQILSGIDRTITHFTISILHPHLNLIGYSGGGAVAAIIAARRHDVLSLRTIAGNLDPEGNDRLHAADPPDDFVDPMEIAPRLATMPQEHLVGDKDIFVPPFLTANFVKAVGDTNCLRVLHVAEATHQEGWDDAWAEIVQHQPTCKKPAR